MKTIMNQTRCNNLFNKLGILHACGDYAGYYQNEAYSLLNLDNNFEGSEWADIMSDSKGNQYAVHAEGDLTLDGFCEYRKLEDNEKVKDFGTDFLK